MKKMKLFFSLMMGILIYLPASAYDFEVDGIYYNIVSLEDLTCEVTYNSQNRKYELIYFDGDEYGSRAEKRLNYTYPSYKGDIIIPNKVTYKNKELTVVGIGEYAFINCEELTSLTLPSSIISIAEVIVAAKYNCVAGAFDYCNITTLNAGNAYILKMFNRSFADKSGCDTQENLKNLILSNDFTGEINVNYEAYDKLRSIRSLPLRAPLFSEGPHFTKEQFHKMLIYVPEQSMEDYYESDIWSNFWDLVNLNSERTPTEEFRVYDFEQDKIYYNIISEEEFTCEVTHKDKIDYYNPIPSYIGRVTIPESVIFRGKEYSVIGVGVHSFYKCSDVRSISLPSTINYVSQLAYAYCYPDTLIVKNGVSLTSTPSNLKYLVISSDFIGQIERDFSESTHFTDAIFLQTNTPPVFSEGKHFSNLQYLELPIWVPEDVYPLYQSADVWKDFWELNAMKSVKSITLNETYLSLEPKQTFQLTPTVLPEDAFDPSVIWNSSNPSAAIVDANGLITAVTKGDAVITVSATDGSGVYANCDVHVDLLVKEIALSEKEISLEPGAFQKLEIALSPSEAFVKEVIWSSEDENVASVDQSGNVTANNIGITNINVSTTDGSNLTTSCKVTVAELVKSIDVSPSEATINEGESLQLTCVVMPETATYKEVVWSSEDEDVATVDSDGIVTSVSSGSVKIKATASDGSNVFGESMIIVEAVTLENDGICYQRNSPSSLKIVSNPESPYSGDFIVPSSAIFYGQEMPVTEIGVGAFSNCENLTSIVIPSSITKIKEHSFNGCSNLEFVKICDGSIVDNNIDILFPDSPIKDLYVGSDAVTYNVESRILSSIQGLTLGNSISTFPPSTAFKNLKYFIVEDGDTPIVEPDGYCTKTMSKTSQQTIRDPYTKIYYRFFYLIEYTHLAPVLTALQNGILDYIYVGRIILGVDVDKSKEKETKPTIEGGLAAEQGWKDEYYYSYYESIAKTDYNRYPIEDISFEDEIVELMIGETIKLIPLYSPSKVVYAELVWTSSDEKIATVDIFGNVKKISEGEATITVSTLTPEGAKLSASCKIVDEGASVDHIKMDSDGLIKVYNLEGILIKDHIRQEELRQLPSGIYIIVSSSKSFKIKI